MSPIFVQYPKCSTCRRAAQWLREHEIQYTDRDIVADKPTETELTEWISASGMPTARFFNTSGLVYKALGLKDVVKNAPNDVLINHLASNGKLVRRPIFVSDKCVLVGFQEDVWAAALL